MLFSSSIILVASAAFFELAEAGPKRPRAPKAPVKARSYTNSSSAIALNIRTNTGTRNATAP